MQKLNYKRIKVLMAQSTVSDEEIYARVEGKMQSLIKYEEVNGRPLKNGDKANIDFIGSVNGVEFDGGKAQGYDLHIGSGMFIKGFEEQLIGMNVGETRVITVTFPQDYVADLAGKEANFKVTLNKIFQKQELVFNDKTVQALNIENVKTCNDLIKCTHSELLNEKVVANYEKWQKDVYAELLKLNPVQVEGEVVEKAIVERLAQLDEAAATYGVSVEYFLGLIGLSNVEEYKLQLQEEVLNDLKVKTVLSLIASELDIEVTIDELNEYYSALANSKKLSVDQVKKMYSLKEVQTAVLMQKATEIVFAYPTEYAYANAGLPQAQVNLAKYCLEDGEREQAISWLNKAAEQGEEEAVKLLKQLR